MKVIAFSLWGANPIYTNGMIRNCVDAQRFYPDWVVWVYVNNTVPQDVVEMISSTGGKVIRIGGFETTSWNMMWRFLPSGDSDVEVFLSRDADSRFTWRESDLVAQWMASDKELHIIRDHQYHQEVIMGGLFGLKQGMLNRFFYERLLTFRRRTETEYSTDYQKIKANNLYSIDQYFLKELYGRSEGKRLTHVSAGAFYPGDVLIPGPSDGRYIGMQIDPDTDCPQAAYVAGLVMR